MRLIVGLGNPGDRYKSTRHNVGFRCIDFMAKAWNIPTKERRAKAVLGQGSHLGQDLVLAKPRTFMNNSGEGIVYLLARFGSRISELVVIYDEMELPLGRLRIRPAGSAAGHNGMRSIIDSLGTQEFTRIRLGIGSPADSQESIPHVLGRFSGAEEPLIARAVDNVTAAVECLLENNVEIAMNRFNQVPE